MRWLWWAVGVVILVVGGVWWQGRHRLAPADPGPTLEVAATMTPAIMTPASLASASARGLATPQGPLTDQEARVVLNDLLDTPDTARAALRRVLVAGDKRFIAPLLELARASQIGFRLPLTYVEIVVLLETLSGETYGSDWPEWIAWYALTDLKPPPGFTPWKGRLMSKIDDKFGRFFDETFPSRIRIEEIVWGGVPLDGIPALDNPKLLKAEDATYLTEGEPVFGVSINGEHRAYPLRILDWHEMANDIVGGVPVSLAYCTLCGAGVLYKGQQGSLAFTFGSSGFLMRSNKLMYDRQTYTLWNQLTGEPVLGPLADHQLTLEVLPIVVTDWASWRTQHPATTVLDLRTGYFRAYFPGAAYGSYFADPTTMFPVGQRSDQLKTKDRVFALRLGGVPKAYALTRLSEEKVVNDALGGQTLVVVAQRPRIQVLTEDRFGGQSYYDAGAEVRAYERGTFQFGVGPDADTLVDAAGQPWRITEDALVGPQGVRLPRLPGHLAYWFGWYAYFPQTLIYK